MSIQIFSEVIFWIFIFCLIHSYILYPLSIAVISLFVKKNDTSETIELPDISVLISAYNEEKVISDRVENIAQQNYDFNKLELLIGSDCSSDKTNEILKSLQQKYNWLSVFLFDKRRGKAAVLNDLIENAKGSIIVFSDANTVFEKDAVLNLIREFGSPQIGGVSGKLELLEPKDNFEKSNQEQNYWKYEVLIKKNEGKLGVLIGANGGIFAIRKELFDPIPVNKAVTDDLFITLTVLKKKFKFYYTFSAIATENTAVSLKTEFKRKIRFAATNLQTLHFFKDLIFNKNILLTYSLWSHKLIRWILPILLIMIFLINIFLTGFNPVYKWTFFSQIVVYLLAVVGYFASKKNLEIPLVTSIFYFVYSNLAIMIGFLKYLNKSHSGIWEPTTR